MTSEMSNLNAPNNKCPFCGIDTEINNKKSQLNLLTDQYVQHLNSNVQSMLKSECYHSCFFQIIGYNQILFDTICNMFHVCNSSTNLERDCSNSDIHPA